MKIGSVEEANFQSTVSQRADDSVDTGKLQVSQVDGLSFSSREPKVVKKQQTERLDKEIFASRMSPDDSKVAVTTLDGQIVVFSTKEDGKRRSKGLTDGVPATCVLWKSQKELLVGDTKGKVHEVLFDKTENGEIKRLSQYSDPEEQVPALDHSPQLGITLIGGKAMKVTVLNEQTKKPVRVYEPGDTYAAGHTNRIFALKLVENAPNSFLSAGWDGTMFLWDVRASKAALSVFGPVISGDALDVHDNLILTGSYRDKDSLELYDLRTLKKVCNLDWSLSPSGFNYVSSCRFSKNKDDGQYIIAGSCLSNQVGLFRRDIVYTNELLIGGMKKGIYTCGFASAESKFYMGTSDGEFTLFHYFKL